MSWRPYHATSRPAQTETCLPGSFYAQGLEGGVPVVSWSPGHATSRPMSSGLLLCTKDASVPDPVVLCRLHVKVPYSRKDILGDALRLVFVPRVESRSLVPLPVDGSV